MNLLRLEANLRFKVALLVIFDYYIKTIHCFQTPLLVENSLFSQTTVCKERIID